MTRESDARRPSLMEFLRERVEIPQWLFLLLTVMVILLSILDLVR